MDAQTDSRKGVMEGSTDTAGACLELANDYQDQLMTALGQGVGSPLAWLDSPSRTIPAVTNFGFHSLGPSKCSGVQPSATATTVNLKAVTRGTPSCPSGNVIPDSGPSEL